MSRKRMQRWGSARSVTAGVALALLLVAPVEANWLARGSAVLGVGHSLKRNLGEGIDLMGEALDAAMHGDAERMREIGEEIEALPGRLVRDAFPVFKLGAAVRDATAAAGEKLKSAAGRIPRLRSEALGTMASSRERLRSVPLKVRRYYGDADGGGADPRMALAVEEEERALFGADTRTSDEPALAAVPALTANGDGNAEANSERQEQAVQVVVQDSDPWAADEDGSQSSAWDQEPASGGMQVAWVEVEETPEEEVMEDDGDDYSGVLNALLSDDALAGDGTSASGETVAGKGSEASADVLPAEGTRADAVETSKWPPRKRFRDCAECPEMVVVPAGSFMMGSPEGEEGRSDSEGPRHRVTIAKPFAVGVYEVTNGQYSTFARETRHHSGRGDCWNDYRGYSETDAFPVGCVNWHDAQAYVLWLSRKTGAKYRLLSEAEWEYAARAGTDTSRYWGDNPSSACKYANVVDRTYMEKSTWTGSYHECRDGHLWFSPVGTFAPNNFGLYDMLGNKWEYIEDCRHGNYEGAPSDGIAWNQSGNCNVGVLRGGSAKSDVWGGVNAVRSAARVLGFSRTYYFREFGFRVARTLE